jgi:hypothetical protein
METVNQTWSEEKKQIAEICEAKGCTMFYDEERALYLLKNNETELISNKDAFVLRDFIKEYKPVTK